jgi:hypothetical protein
MPPQPSIVPDPELSQGARGEPVRVPLSGSSKLNDPQRDKFSYLVSRAGRKLKLGAHRAKCLAHGVNVLGLESESTGSWSWHRGATDVRSGAVYGHRRYYLNRKAPTPRGSVRGRGQHKAGFWRRQES